MGNAASAPPESSKKSSSAQAPSSSAPKKKSGKKKSKKQPADVTARAQKVAAEWQAGIQNGIKKLEENDHPAAQLIDSFCGPYLDSADLREYDDDEDSVSSEEDTTVDYRRRKEQEEESYLSHSDYESTVLESKSDSHAPRSYDTDDSYTNSKKPAAAPVVTAQPAAAAAPTLPQPLASAFAKRCYFTKSGIGKMTQHYEGLTLTGNVVLMLAAAMKLKGCPTICDEDLRRVEQTYPNQFSRLPDELLLSSGWRRISKYCHFSNKPVPDGVPFFHSRQRLHPSGGYYFLLAAAVGMVRPIDVEPLNRDTLVLLETDFPNACDNAPTVLIKDPSEWTLVDRFCFFSGGPINTEEDVYYQADFDGNPIFMLAFLSPSLTPAELYKLESTTALETVAAVQEVESIYDLTERDFDDLKLYHLGPCRALPPYILQPTAWTKVLPPHFLRARETALMRAHDFDPTSYNGGVMQHPPLLQQPGQMIQPPPQQVPPQQTVQSPQQQPQPYVGASLSPMAAAMTAAMQQHNTPSPAVAINSAQAALQQQQQQLNAPMSPMTMNNVQQVSPHQQPLSPHLQQHLQQPHVVGAYGGEPVMASTPEYYNYPGQQPYFPQSPHVRLDSRELQRQMEEEGAFIDPSVPMDEAIATHAARTTGIDPPEDEPPSLSKRYERYSPPGQTFTTMKQPGSSYSSPQQQYRSSPEATPSPTTEAIPVQPQVLEQQPSAESSVPPQYRSSPENTPSPTYSAQEAMNYPSEGASPHYYTESPTPTFSDNELTTTPGPSIDSDSPRPQESLEGSPQFSLDIDDGSPRKGMVSPGGGSLPPRSPGSDFSRSSAMKGAQELLRKNRQRRLEAAEAARKKNDSETQSEGGNSLPSEATWESGSEITTSVVSGSSVWTDGQSNPDRSSRRALILQMAKARMRNNKSNASMDEEEEEKKLEGAPRENVNVDDLAGDLD